MTPGWRNGGRDLDGTHYELSFEEGRLVVCINDGEAWLYFDWEQSVDLVAGLAFQMRGFEQRED